MNTMSVRLFLGVAVAIAAVGCASNPNPSTKSAEERPGPPLGLEPPPGSDGTKLENAIAAMDRGDMARAIRTLEDIRSRHPENGLVLHELALAYRLSKKPGEAVKVLMPFRRRLPPPPLAGLGSALDEAGRSADAISVFREGLERYPRSGLLYADFGTTVFQQGKTEEALELFQKGIEVDPATPANYIRVAIVLAQTDHRGLALVFGETFRVLEPTTERSHELARVMVDVCRHSVKMKTRPDGSLEGTVTLAPNIVVQRQEQVAELPLVNVFELAFGPPLVRAHQSGFSLKSLHQARVEFIQVMNRPDSPFDWNAVPIFRFMREANANGMLEIYDYWLFGPAFPEEFEAWAKQNQSNAERLGQYLGEHPLFAAPRGQ
jgi:tetratricopeptide (TPR) repeat protein